MILMFQLVNITHRYILKNMPFLVWIAAIPAIILGLFSHPSSPFIFLYKYNNFTVTKMPGGFYSLFGQIFDFSLPWWQALLFLLLVPVFISLLLGLIERHLRSGRFGFRNPIRRINETIMGLGPVLLIMFCFTIVSMFFTVGAVTLGHYIFTGFGSKPSTVSFIVAVVVMCGVQLVTSAVYAILILIPPVNIIVGYPFYYSAGYAQKLRHKNNFGMYFACLYPYIAVTVFGALLYIIIGESLAALPWARDLIYKIINIFSYIYLFLYFPALSMTAYYELSGSERMDYKRVFLRKGR